MLKYILFALLFVVVILNFSIKFVWERVFKKAINSKEEAAIRFVVFALALLLAVLIIFAA